MPDTTFHARWLLGPGLALGILAAASASAQDCFDETDLGSIEIGKFGDIVVLDEDPLACEEDRIKDIGVLRTFVGGFEAFGPGHEDPGPIDGVSLD